MKPSKTIDVNNPPAATILVTLPNVDQYLHVPLGTWNKKCGQKYQAYDMNGKKEGRSSYIVDNPEEFGIKYENYIPSRK